MTRLTNIALIMLAFTLTAAAQQRIVSVDPDHAWQDEIVEVWIVGEGTHFTFNQECRVIGTALVHDNENINGGNLRIMNDELMAATFNIPNDATTGPWDVEVRQDRQYGLVSLEDGFNIQNRTMLLVPEEYRTILEAVTMADEGDTILVAPGEYSGSFSFDGKPIVLASHYILEGREAYIDSTILDGAGAFTVIVFENGESNDAHLVGFTIQNGLGSFGGGIYCNTFSSPSISNCKIINNNGRAIGGGVYCYGGSNPIVRNCLIAGNSTAVKGGGIACRSDSRPVFINCTITDNEAENGGGALYCLSGGEPVFVNSIFWGNSAQQVLFNDSGSPNSVYFNTCDIQGGEESIETSGNGSAELESCFDSDPLFREPDSLDYALEPGSPCIDTGIARFVLEGDTLIDLVEGDYIGEMVDVGAYEFDPRHAENETGYTPANFKLEALFPNPFNSNTTIAFSLEARSEVTVSVYDLAGKIIDDLTSNVMDTGRHEISWDASGCTLGIYLISVEVNGQRIVRKALYLK